MNLNQLIKSCKKNNAKAQSDLYQKYKDTLYVLCLKYCRNTEEAEDNLHDTFIEIFKSISKYKGKGSFEGWMKRIAINKAITKYNKGSFSNIAIKDELLSDTSIDAESMQIPLHTILNLIQQLPDQYRLVFNLYELDDYSHKEIASLLSISESASKSNLHRAKSILKKKLREETTLKTYSNSIA